MQLTVPYKLLDLTPSKELMEFDYDTLTMEHLTRNTGLRKINPYVFGEIYTFSILFFSMELWQDPVNNLPIIKNDDHPVHSLALAEVRKLEEMYDAKAKIAVLDYMPPGSKINRHFDQSKMYEICHRVHLPLYTNPDVLFYIDDEPHHFPAGQFFEFDNRRYHMVENRSNDYRIHMVVDLLPNSYV